MNQDASEAEIVDNYRLDHLYTHAFKDGSGKFFTVVSRDEAGAVVAVDAEDPRPLRNKIKTTLTFVRGAPGGHIRAIEFKRFKFYKRNGYVEQDECIRFSFGFFAGLVGFLQGLAGLDLDSINERRIPLADTPDLDAETRRRFRNLIATKEGQAMIAEAVRSGDLTSADIENIGYRKTQLSVFEQLLANNGAVEAYRVEHSLASGDERVWQHFFEANTWIFGYSLAFVFNKSLDGEKLSQAVHGHDAAGPGKIADALMKNGGHYQFAMPRRDKDAGRASRRKGPV